MAEHLIRGGVDILQIRAKNASPEEIVSWSLQVSPITRAAAIPLIINDYPELVEKCGADGCHVGQDDISVENARSMMPRRSLCGKSTHSLTQARAAMTESPDYIGFGPLFPTQTKPDYQNIGLTDIATMMKSVSCPAFCIGGIKLENLQQVIAAGARNVVIVSGLLCAPDPEATARQVRQTLTAI